MNSLPNLFFVGKAGAGKTYVCNYLVKNYKYTLTKFASPVYEIARDFLKMQGKDRKLLQTIGSDVGRDMFDQNLWVNRYYENFTIAKITSEKLNIPFNVVVDDCRFPEEKQLLEELGFVGIYLDVPDSIRIKRLEGRDGTAQIETLSHKSEMQLDIFKDSLIKVDSSGTLEQTYENLEQTLEFIRRERNNVKLR